MCLENDGVDILLETYNNIPNKQKKNIIILLEDENEYDLLKLLNA